MRVIQETLYGCFGATAAAIVGKSFREMAEEIGHDGSDHAYSDYEIFKYLAGYGILPNGEINFGYDHDTEVPTPDTVAEDAHTEPGEYIYLSSSLTKRLRELAGEQNTTVELLISGMIFGSTESNKSPVVTVPKNAACKYGISGAILEAAGSDPLHVPFYLNEPAILIVLRSLNIYSGHAVYFNGVNVVDPGLSVGENRKLSDYVITRWIPLRDISYQKSWARL